MRNSIVRRVGARIGAGALLAVLVAALLSTGCDTPNRTGPNPTPPIRDPRTGLGPPPTAPGTTIEYYMHLGVLYKKEGGVWYQYDPGTGLWNPITGNPPGYTRWTYAIGPDSPIPVGASTDRNQLGIVPDANGQVSPIYWFNSPQLASHGALTSSDRIDFFMFIDAQWEMPTDADAALLASIGSVNVQYYTWPLNDGLPDPLVLKLNDVTIADLANFMHQLQFLEGVAPQTTVGPWRFTIDAQMQSLTIRFRNSVAYTIPL